MRPRGDSGAAAAWRVYSKVLASEVWIAADDAVARELEAENDVPVFTAAELMWWMENQHAEDFKAAVLVKRSLPGSRVIEVNRWAPSRMAA